MDQFADKMLCAKVFTCASCDNLLTTPIVLVQDIGNVCQKCCQENAWNGLPNINLEVVLKELTIPCRYLTTGCKERVPFPDIQAHENKCKYHEKPCLLIYEGCEWKGVQTDFPTHFIECHSEHVVTNQSNNVFVIDISLSGPTNITKLLKGRKECILRIRTNDNSFINSDLRSLGDENATLLYTICDVKNTDCDYECVIKHMGTNSNCVETKCKVSSLNTIETVSAQMSLSALKQMTEAADSVTIQLKIAGGNDVQEMDEKMLQHFECPVCKMLMRPPIYQCKFGHSFCNNCRPRLEKCPNCRAMFGTTRNYSLEALTEGIQYSCMYHNIGCEEMLTANDSGKHEANCPYKPYPCPLEDCTFRGSHSNIGKHLDELHRDKMIATDYHKTTVEFRLEQMIDFYNFQQKTYMVFDENIFRLSFKRNSDYSFWAVEVLRKKDDDSVFIYDIGVIDMRKPDRKLIRCDVCFADINSDDLFKKCILFPNNILASYASNGLFTYYCHIRKRQ